MSNGICSENRCTGYIWTYCGCDQVPKDYLSVAEAVKRKAAADAAKLKSGAWPVLEEHEFWDLVSSVPNSNIKTAEELRLGKCSRIFIFNARVT